MFTLNNSKFPTYIADDNFPDFSELAALFAEVSTDFIDLSRILLQTINRRSFYCCIITKLEKNANVSSCYSRQWI